jgi:hypothetical protein
MDEERPLLEGPTVRLDVTTHDVAGAVRIAETLAGMAVGFAADDMVAAVLVVPQCAHVEVEQDIEHEEDR